MITYKLFRKRKDGSLGPLFISARQRIPIGKWLEAEDIPTKGFKHRPGWHSKTSPAAPHLSKNGRVWAKVEIQDYYIIERPAHQGGTWLISKWMKVIEECEDK